MTQTGEELSPNTASLDDVMQFISEENSNNEDFFPEFQNGEEVRTLTAESALGSGGTLPPVTSLVDPTSQFNAMSSYNTSTTASYPVTNYNSLQLLTNAASLPSNYAVEHDFGQIVAPTTGTGEVNSFTIQGAVLQQNNSPPHIPVTTFPNVPSPEKQLCTQSTTSPNLLSAGQGVGNMYSPPMSSMVQLPAPSDVPLYGTGLPVSSPPMAGQAVVSTNVEMLIQPTPPSQAPMVQPMIPLTVECENSNSE